MKLKYVGKPGFDAPGSGWPAADHEEPDPEVAQAKLDSGFYEEELKATPEPKEREGGRTWAQ